MATQACRCCNAQLTKQEFDADMDMCAYCDNHAHVLNRDASGRTSCDLRTPKGSAVYK